MNKHNRRLAAALCLLLLLTACGKTQPEAPAEPPAEAPTPVVEEQLPAHTHEAESWDRNMAEHWQVCACGETFGLEAHGLGEDLFCTVCGSEVWDYGDGSGSVIDYSEYGDWLRLTDFDADGNMTFDQVSEIEYDADGSKLQEKIYQNGVLVEDMEYAEGGVPQKMTSYYEDGTWGVNEYDENGNVVLSYSYNAAGEVDVEIRFEYESDADGWFYEVRQTVIFADSETHVTEHNAYGDQTLWQVYLPDGTLDISFVSEYVYDENGNILTKTTDYSGERVDVTTYTYDENGCLLLEETVGTDGTSYLTEYRVDEDGWSACVRDVETYADGSYLVREYNEFEEIVSERMFDANGSEIPMEEAFG